MNRRLIFWYLIAGTGAVSVAVALPHLGLRRDDFTAMRTGWCVAALVCQMGAAWYFLDNLSGFKRGLKVAYILLAVGILCLGIAQLQLPIITYLNAWGSFYADGGLVLIPYLLTAASMYLSMRKFAQLMDIRSRWMKVWLVALLSVVGVAASVGVLLRLEHDVVSIVYDALVGWTEALALASVILAHRVKRSLTPTFGPAMNWLLVSFAITMLAGVQQLWLQHFTHGDWWFRTQGWQYWLLVAASMAFLKTGLVFRELTQGLAANANMLDVVMYTAGLVSRPGDVGQTLNRLRSLTASLAPGAALNGEQRQRLIGIYLDLEQYLVTREPLRSFTVERLRVGLPDSFVSLLPARR